MLMIGSNSKAMLSGGMQAGRFFIFVDFFGEGFLPMGLPNLVCQQTGSAVWTSESPH